MQAGFCASDSRRDGALLRPAAPVLNSNFAAPMLLSKEYVGYLAREITKKLVQGQFIETSELPAVTQGVHAAILDELSVEDRINDEVRIILEQYSDEMRKSGASYQELFKKVKMELVRKYKAVL